MNQRTFLHFALAGLLGLASGLPMLAHADDTEIYTGGSAVEGVKPNILFILDTSGSMSAFDGESKDRLDRMKDAFTTLIDSIDNVNVGLMRFTDPGGPILFPVTAVDADADAIASGGQPDVYVQITDNADDAEELVAITGGGPAVVGDVKLDSFYLELLDTPGFGDERSVLSEIASGEDDAEHSASFYNNNSTTLETVFNTSGNATRTVGFRFGNVEDLDRDSDGATVLFSQLLLTSKDDRDGALDLKVFGFRPPNATSIDMQSFPSGENSAGNCPLTQSSQDIYCRLGLDDAAEHNAGLDFGNVESFSRSGANAGNVTDAVVTWADVPQGVTDEVLESPDLSPVIQEIFDHPRWQESSTADDLGLFYTGTTASHRRIYPRDASSTRQAKLRVDYVPAGAAAGRQVVALRFRDVKLPSFASIESARLELYPAGDSADAMSILISAERVGDATPFTAYEAGAAQSAPATDRISTRLAGRRTAQTAVWTLTGADPWSHDSPVQSVDLSSVLAEVVRQPGWCGGNDLVLFLEYNAIPGAPVTRRVIAHDADPGRAPALLVNYDKTDFDPGEGCTTEQIVRRVAADRDDAEEFIDFGFVQLTSSVLETPSNFGFDVTSGAIFRNVSIPPGAQVTRAVLELASNNSESANSTTLLIKGQRTTGSIPEFASSSFNVSSRTSGAAGTSASVTVSVPPASLPAHTPFQTADISTVIQELVDQTDWSQGDDIALTMGPGTGTLEIRSHDGDPAQAPTLIADIQFNVGDVLLTLPPGEAPGVTTVRQRIKELVQAFTHDGFTPIVDTLYEAARYYRGEGVLYGTTRGDGSDAVQRNTRLSHIGSYTGGTVEYPSGCNTDDSNLSSDDCRDQRILGSPVYTSPITESCQANFVVLLTDGEANNNHSVSLIQDMAGLSACQSLLSNGESVRDGERCGVDVSRFLFENDQSSAVAGENKIVTYTIGFNLAGNAHATQFLRDVASESGGRFFEAGSEAQLLSVFQAIFADVLSRATSFAAPSLSVNAFNRLEDRNEVYFSLFEPSPTVAWDGNIKKFQLCQSENDDCVTVSNAEVGDIMDARDPAQVAVGDDGRILDTALSFWSTSPDGPEVLLGGAGAQVPNHASRRVLTFTDDALQTGTPPSGTASFFPSSVDLSALENRVIDSDGDGILDGLSGSDAERLQQTRELLGMGTETTAQINEQILWIRGKDVDGIFEDADFGENRWTFGDPLHGNPLAITYGGTEADPIIKLLAGTNDGGIRLVNSNTGQEEFVFFPSEMLALQKDLRENAVSASRLYGVDGTATPWIRDAGDLGVIEPQNGDFVRFFMGMRRGGNSYYALDITPTNEIAETDFTTLTNISPKLMWRIRGGTPEYPMLGQTWSRPVLASMLVGTTVAGEAERRAVIIFAGGYEPSSQDSGFAQSNPTAGLGNAIYVADAETGERLFFVGGPNAIQRHSGSTPVRGLEIADMAFPIPSDVAAFDANGDGSVDRLYVGDTGGQMWRVDFQPNRAGGTGQDGLLGIVGKLASVSFAPSDSDGLADAPADERKFFNPPSIIQVRGAGSHSNEDYDLVSAVTGNRAHPLDLDVRDRFYAFRDYAITPFLDSDSDGLADNFTTIRGDLDGDPNANPPINGQTFNEMLDFTIVNGPEDLTDPNSFVTSAGYYLRLDTGGPGNGEKGLAAPTTLAGKLFFTTFLPNAVVDTDNCSLAEGRGQLYGLDAITGAAIFNWDTPGDPTINRADRTYALGSGIPSNPVPVFFPEKVMLLVGVGGGAQTVDPSITVPQGRTYWFQQ